MAIARILAIDETHAPEGFVRVASAGSVLVTWRGAGYGACIAAGSLGLVLGLLLLAGAGLEPRMAKGAGTVAAVVAAASAYLLLAGLFNRTALCLQDRRIVVRQRPLPCPWPARFQANGQGFISAVDVYRVLVEREPLPSHQNDRVPEYGVAVMTIGTGQEYLLTRLGLCEAAYLVQEIRAFVGIDD